MSDESFKAAKEAAEKVTAMLMASGQLRPSDLNKSRGKSAKSTDLFVEEVVINDAPMTARNFLTRSVTQEDISKMSGASVSTRGRYMTQEEIDKNTSNDRPLYLHIQGMNQQDVKVAVGRIMHLIMEHTHRRIGIQNKNKGHRFGRSPPPDSVGNGGGNCATGEAEQQQVIFPQNVLREKVFLPPTPGMHPIDVRIRLNGENNSNIKYIVDETGATIFMRGIGSGFIEPSTGMESQEPLHFYLEHNNQEKFNEAKDLVVNLSLTILTEIQQPQQEPLPQHQVPQPPHFPPNIPSQIAINGNGIVHHQQVLSAHQIQHPNQQIVVSAVGQLTPGMAPPQIGLQMNPLQVTHGTTQVLVAPQTVAAGQTITASALPGQQIQEISHAAGAQTTQLVQISVPSSGPNIMTQQLVQTSAGPQLVQLPPGTQIISTPEGPRLVAIAPASTVSTSFVTPVIQTNAEQHVQLGLALPQPIPQPVPPVSSRGPDGESYLYETEANKLSSAPVLLTTTPTTTFAYLHPPPSMEQEVANPHIQQPPPNSIAIEASQAHWIPSSNSVVFSQVTVPTTQMEIFSQAQGSQTQVTYVHTSLTNEPIDTYSTTAVPSSFHGQPNLNIEQRKDWNLNSAVPHFSQESNGNSIPEKDGDTDSFSFHNETNARLSGLRSPMKGGSFLWAHYPQERDGLPRGPPLSIQPGLDELPGQFQRDSGGRFTNESEDTAVMKSSLEHLPPDVSSQGPRLPGRKLYGYSTGSFTAESKRRRSFKPKGDFRGGNGPLKRDIDGQFASARFGDQEMSRYYSGDAQPGEDNFHHGLSSQTDAPPTDYSSDYPPPPLHREEYGPLRGSVPGSVEVSYPPPGPPPADVSVTPWRWSHAGPNLPLQHPNFGQRPGLKSFESPWESGRIPGMSPESIRPRGALDSFDPLFRPKLAKYRRF